MQANATTNEAAAVAMMHAAALAFEAAVAALPAALPVDAEVDAIEREVAKADAVARDILSDRAFRRFSEPKLRARHWLAGSYWETFGSVQMKAVA
ncbi:hypothetical protein NP284_40130 [Rhodopseudomonas pseudopalustris]|uniref:hypothetical protein n=1 Tax=Rhodopseudomonas pseudopalustris TaxID=1513892 RepID=UPI003F98F793